MFEDWHVKLLSVVDCLAREAERLRGQAAALSEPGPEPCETTGDADQLALSRCIQDLA